VKLRPDILRRNLFFPGKGSGQNEQKFICVAAPFSVGITPKFMKQRAPLLLALAITAFAGCVTFKPRPLASADTAARLENRSLDDPGLHDFLARNLAGGVSAWPLKSWDLESLTLAAVYFNPNLEVARAQWRVAQAGVITAGGRPNPTVGITPGYNISAASGANPWIPGMTVDLPIETAGKRDHRLTRAHYLSESARWNMATTAWKIRGAVRAALFDYADAQTRQRLLARQLETQQAIFSRLEQRVLAGAISRNELVAPQIALIKIKTELGDVRQREPEAFARLAEALGVPLTTLKNVSLSGFPPAPSQSELTSLAARQQALHSRADVAAALAEYAASQSALQLEIAKQYPDVHLGTGYQWDQGQSKWQLGLTAEIPVLNRNQGPIAEAEARRAEAEARLLAVQAKVIAEIEQAVATHDGAQKRLGLLRNLADAQQRQHAAVAAQVQAGAADQIDLLNLELELAAAAAAQWEGEARLAQAWGQLEDVIQHPLTAAGVIESAGGTTARKEQP